MPACRLLFSLTTPLDKLEGMLQHDFAGQTLTMQQIYQQHSIDRGYVKKNYKAALLNLELVRSNHCQLRCWLGEARQPQAGVLAPSQTPFLSLFLHISTDG